MNRSSSLLRLVTRCASFSSESGFIQGNGAENTKMDTEDIKPVVPMTGQLPLIYETPSADAMIALAGGPNRPSLGSMLFLHFNDSTVRYT
jgi:hypothetical protein